MLLSLKSILIPLVFQAGVGLILEETVFKGNFWKANTAAIPINLIGIALFNYLIAMR